jgi:mono/diheme cytochrome c family protein
MLDVSALRATFAILGLLHAATTGAAECISPASIARGKIIVNNMCASCHGLDDQSANPEFRKLAGQLREFLVLQLRNYKLSECLPPMKPANIANTTKHAAGEAIFKRGKPGAPAYQYCSSSNLLHA